MNRTAALITDFSAFGKCAASLALPVLACCMVSASVLPTCVLSSHTGGLGTPDRIDMTDRLDAYIDQWSAAGAAFDAISIGYLSSAREKDAVKRFLRVFRRKETLVLLDPVMADNGRLYSGIENGIIDVMRELLSCADIVTPNYTEGCLLAGIPCSPEPDAGDILRLCRTLSDGRRDIVLTGIPGSGTLSTAVLPADGEFDMTAQRLIEGSYHGTGDLFAAVLLGMLMNGKGLRQAVGCASDFVFRSIEATVQNTADSRFGLDFERLLPVLWQTLRDEEENI